MKLTNSNARILVVFFVVHLLFYLFILWQFIYLCIILICKAHFCLHTQRTNQWLDRIFPFTRNAFMQEHWDFLIKYWLGKAIWKWCLPPPLSSVVNQKSWAVQLFLLRCPSFCFGVASVLDSEVLGVLF